MPPTLATTLHYLNSWHSTYVKTWSSLIPQVHFQPLPKLPVIPPPIKFVLISTRPWGACFEEICYRNRGASPSTFSTFTQASSDHTSNQICAHNPSTNHVSQANLSNSLTSQYPSDPGEHVWKKSATEIREQGFPVKWFKFICPSFKPRMTENSTLTPVHVAYSPIVFMNHHTTCSATRGVHPTLSFHLLHPFVYHVSLW